MLMKSIIRSTLPIISCVIAMTAAADVTRTQTLQIHSGWNAVYLEVSPTDRDPSDLFDGLPVEIAAAYFPVQTPVEFVDDPGSTNWKKPEWRVWYAPHRADGVLSNLHAIIGVRAYLLKATQAFQWKVTGDVLHRPVVWQPQSLNFVGFCVSESAPPSFESFFAGSEAHQPIHAYRLVNDRWLKVTNPGDTNMHSGEAYWIRCNRQSDYSGPLEMRLPLTDELFFGEFSDTLEVEFSNRSAAPLLVSLSHVSGDLPMLIGLRQDGRLGFEFQELPAAIDLGAIPFGRADAIRLYPKRSVMTSNEANVLVRISTDAGAVSWLPIRAQRP